MNEEKYGFVYVWRDKKHNRLYVGCHWGTESDGYLCSSNWMRDSYKRRPQDFKRRVVSRVYTSRQDMLTEEHKWLSQIKDCELGKKFYNLNKHHFGHWSSDEHLREKTIKSMTGRKWSVESKERFKGNTNGLGKPCSEEKKVKISAAQKGRGDVRSLEGKQRQIDALAGKPSWNKGKKIWSDAEKARIGLLSKGRVMSVESSEKKRLAMIAHFARK